MRFFVIDHDQRFLQMCKNTFRFTPANGSMHWIIMNDPTGCMVSILRRTRNTVLLCPSTGPPRFYFDGMGCVVTSPLENTTTYDAFHNALTTLKQVVVKHPTDVVIVARFGPPSKLTCKQMHDAFLNHVLLCA